MQYEKLKGIVKESTLSKILAEASRVVNDPKEKRIYFFTRKSQFVAEEKNVRHWKIFQIHGEME